MAELAVWIDLSTGTGRLVGRAVVMMRVMPEMRCLLRFLLMLAIAGRRSKGGIQRQQDQQKKGEEASHERQNYISRI